MSKLQNINFGISLHQPCIILRQNLSKVCIAMQSVQDTSKVHTREECRVISYTEIADFNFFSFSVPLKNDDIFVTQTIDW